MGCVLQCLCASQPFLEHGAKGWGRGDSFRNHLCIGSSEGGGQRVDRAGSRGRQRE